MVFCAFLAFRAFNAIISVDGPFVLSGVSGVYWRYGRLWALRALRAGEIATAVSTQRAFGQSFHPDPPTTDELFSEMNRLYEGFKEDLTHDELVILDEKGRAAAVVAVASRLNPVDALVDVAHGGGRRDLLIRAALIVDAFRAVNSYVS